MELIKTEKEKQLTNINPTIQNLLLTLSQSGEMPNYLCDECQDRGFIYLKEKSTNERFPNAVYTVIKDCVCRLEKLRQVRLDTIPMNFRNAVLAKIEPMPNVHENQKTVIPAMKENPAGSYFLAGKTGKGKSLLMWALYREAVLADKKVVACTLTELLDEYKRFIQLSMANQPLVYPRLSSGDLTQNHTKYSIFLDDIDKARPTEYAMEQLFELANAIYNYQHQVVVTTNLSLAKLIEHFERADERFGGAIVRRLVNNGMVCEMF